MTDDAGDTAFDEVSVIVLPGVTNQAPVAVASASDLLGIAPFEFSLIGSGSTDDKAVVSYFWDLGDGSTSNEMDLEHVFENAGIYEVSLTVTDDEGLTDSSTIVITVTENEEASFDGMTVIAFPNPADLETSIEIRNQTAQVLWIRLHDATGKLIQNYIPEVVYSNGVYVLPLPSLRNGIYFVVLEMDNGVPLHLNLLIRN